jgi:hypothetical protein
MQSSFKLPFKHVTNTQICHKVRAKESRLYSIIYNRYSLVRTELKFVSTDYFERNIKKLKKYLFSLFCLKKIID